MNPNELTPTQSVELAIKLREDDTHFTRNQRIAWCARKLAIKLEMALNERDDIKLQVEKMRPVFDRSGCLLADVERLNAKNIELEEALKDSKRIVDALIPIMEMTDRNHYHWNNAKTVISEITSKHHKSYEHKRSNTNAKS